MKNHSNNHQKEEFRRLIIEGIAEELKNPHPSNTKTCDIIAKGLKEGQKFELTVVTGEYCNYNYSYKLQHKKKKGETRDSVLSAKLTSIRKMNRALRSMW